MAAHRPFRERKQTLYIIHIYIYIFDICDYLMHVDIDASTYNLKVEKGEKNTASYDHCQYQPQFANLQEPHHQVHFMTTARGCRSAH